MIVLEGQPALSHFRRARLESKLQSIAPAVRVRGAWHVYFVEADPGASPDLATLRRVLQAVGADRGDQRAFGGHAEELVLGGVGLAQLVDQRALGLDQGAVLQVQPDAGDDLLRIVDEQFP